MNPLFVGIDVSSKNNVAYLMKPDGGKHSSFSVQNNLGGAKLLSERIVSALGSMQLSDVVIGLEATSIYGDNLVYALREDGSLGRFQRKIHVLNPKQVRKFKEAYSDLPKNDWVDAFVIADHLRFGRINREVYIDDYRYKALQTLTRARFDVIQNLTCEKQRFANYLFLKCSGMAQDKDIQNASATTIALMERFETVDDLANTDLNELTAFHDYNLVIAQPNGNPYDVKTLSSHFKRFVAANGLQDVDFYSLRHAGCTAKLRASGNIKAVQGDMGHASGEMVTKVYAATVEEDRQQNARNLEERVFRKVDKAGETPTP